MAKALRQRLLGDNTIGWLLVWLINSCTLRQTLKRRYTKVNFVHGKISNGTQNWQTILREHFHVLVRGDKRIGQMVDQVLKNSQAVIKFVIEMEFSLLTAPNLRSVFIAARIVACIAGCIEYCINASMA